MNKNILFDNIDRIVVSLKLTIEKLTSLIDKKNEYSNEYINNQINLLQVKLNDEDNYKTISNEKKNMDLMVNKYQSDINNLKKVLKDAQFDISQFGSLIDEKNNIISYEQKEIEALANSLNIVENDEEILNSIKEKRNKIDKLKVEINNFLKEIEFSNQSIEYYNERISYKEEMKRANAKISSGISDYKIDEDNKNLDMKWLNRFKRISDVILFTGQLSEICNILNDMKNYFLLNRIDIMYINSKKDEIKVILNNINSDATYFINTIEIEELLKEKEKITERLDTKNGYVLSGFERNNIYDEIANLNLEISLCDSESSDDEYTLTDYKHTTEKFDADILSKEFECDKIQKDIDELNLRKCSFMNIYNQDELEQISVEIRKKQRQIKSIRKSIGKLRENKIKVESITPFIKQKKKSNELIKESKKNDLELAKEKLYGNLTTKFSLSEDKKNLLYIDLLVELIDFANYLLAQNYDKKVENITLDSVDSLLSVVGFANFDKVKSLYDEDFLEGAKDSIDKLMSYEAEDSFISKLNEQGLKVRKSGKVLKTMEDSNDNVIESIRTKVL